MTITAYPLQWPEGWKRTPAGSRDYGRFARRGEARSGSSWRPLTGVTVHQAITRLRAELERMGIHSDDVVISSNVPLRLDGLPRSDAREPADPGAAVYWIDSGATRCMAIDRYTKVAQNIAALAATIEAMRAIERHGGAAILDRAFTGFTALPAPSAKRDWWEVLGVARDCTRADIRAAYRRLASAAHPDRPGGSHERMAELNAAQDAALRERAQ
ncbi:MAG TPA: J domain-containing protein [Methylibium sp.]|nr:J domain-containing protein [Methylibium sp.]